MVQALHVTLISLISALIGGPAVLAQRDEASISAQQGILNTNRAKWNTNAIKDYKYSYTSAGQPGDPTVNYPWSIIVSSGTPPQAKAMDTKNLARTGITIDQVFDVIQDALNPGRAEDVKVDYNPTYFYPDRAVIIWQRDVSNHTMTLAAFERRSGPPETEYTNNKQLWEGTRIADYSFQYTQYGFTLPAGYVWPLTVVVRSSNVFSATDSRGVAIDFSQYVPSSINTIFLIIERQITENAPFIDVYYDQTRGFPVNNMQLLTATQGLTHYYITGFVYPLVRRLRGETSED